MGYITFDSTLSWHWSKDIYKSCHFAAQNVTTKATSIHLQNETTKASQLSSKSLHDILSSSRDGFLVFFEAFFCVSPSFLRLTALGPFALIVVVGGTGLEIGM